MVLVINAPSPAASKNHATDHPPSCSGCLNPCTKAAITPAAAGVGMPMKYFDPPGAIPCTLKRASRHAQQTKNPRQHNHPMSDSSWPRCVPAIVKLRPPQPTAGSPGQIRNLPQPPTNQISTQNQLSASGARPNRQPTRQTKTENQ